MNFYTDTAMIKCYIFVAIDLPRQRVVSAPRITASKAKDANLISKEQTSTDTTADEMESR